VKYETTEGDEFMKDVENQPVAYPEEPSAPLSELPEIETYLMTAEELESYMSHRPASGEWEI